MTGDFAQTNNCTSIAVNASCTVNVTFHPTAGGARTGTLTVTSNANNSPTTATLTGTGIDSTTNIAAGKTATASSSNGPYVPANLTDADTSSYWESANGAFPQWAQVDLGQSYSVGKVILKLPPATAWATRTETLSVLGSTDGTQLHHARGLGRLHLRPERQRQHGDHHVRGRDGTVRAGQHHRQHRLAGGPAVGLRGVPGQRRRRLVGDAVGQPDVADVREPDVGTTSAAQTVTVHNTGTAAATVSGVGDLGRLRADQHLRYVDRGGCARARSA